VRAIVRESDLHAVAHVAVEPGIRDVGFGQLSGQLVTTLPELFQFSVTSQETTPRDRVPRIVSSNRGCRVEAPFRLKRRTGR